MINYDLNGDGVLDAIELATAKTYYDSQDPEEGELLFDDFDNLTIGEDDDFVFDPAEEW